MENESWKMGNQQTNHETFQLIFNLFSFVPFVLYPAYIRTRYLQNGWSNESSKIETEIAWPTDQRTKYPYDRFLCSGMVLG